MNREIIEAFIYTYGRYYVNLHITFILNPTNWWIGWRINAGLLQITILLLSISIEYYHPKNDPSHEKNNY